MADDMIPHVHRATRSPTPPPGSPTAQFVELVRAVRGDDFVASWLLPGLMIRMRDGSPAFQNCEFTEDRIFTTGVGADRLNRACDQQIRQTEITIRQCPIIRVKFQAWGRKQRDMQRKP